MMRRKLMLLLCVFMIGGSAFAADNDWTAAVDDNWFTGGNWSLGHVPIVDEDADTDRARISGETACIVDAPGAASRNLLVGYGGTAGTLIIKDGGVLTTGYEGQWIGMLDKGTVIVEEGGVMNVLTHFWVGLNGGADGTELILNGGTVDVDTGFDLGRGGGNAACTVYLNDGVLDVEHITSSSSSGWYTKPDSKMDIRFGTFLVDRNLLDWEGGKNFIEEQMAAGKLVAFGGLGTLVYDFDERNAGKTTITAISPLEPSPAYKEIVPANGVDLSWTNLDPCSFYADEVWVDVWFGTEPNKPSDPRYTMQVDAGMNVNTVNVSASTPGAYYWQVDSYLYGDPAVVDYSDPNFSDGYVEGDVFIFEASDDFPPTVTIETPPTLTWAGQPVQLDATISDTGDSVLHIEWSSEEGTDPNITFSPSANVEDPTVAGDSHQPNTLMTIKVWDEFNGEENASFASVNIDIAADQCQAARGGFPRLDQVYLGDYDENCIIDLVDFAMFASQWLDPYQLTAPLPMIEVE